MTQDFARAIGAYRKAAANTRPRLAVVGLFDEAIRAVRRARRAVADRRFEEAHAGLSRASAILLGLAGNLDFGPNPELAMTLKQTYLRNIMALHGGFGKPDMAERYMKLLDGLTALRNSWAYVAGVAEVPVRSD